MAGFKQRAKYVMLIDRDDLLCKADPLQCRMKNKNLKSCDHDYVSRSNTK